MLLLAPATVAYGGRRHQLSCQRILGEVHFYLGEQEEAEKILRDCMVKLESSGRTDDDQLFLATLWTLAMVRSLQDPQEAFTLYSRAYQGYTAHSGSSSLYAARLDALIANLHQERGDHQQAYDYLREAVVVFEREYGPNARKTVQILRDFASCQVQTGRLEDAHTSWARVLMLENQVGAGNRSAMTALCRLAEVEQKQGRF